MKLYGLSIGDCYVEEFLIINLLSVIDGGFLLYWIIWFEGEKFFRFV